MHKLIDPLLFAALAVTFTLLIYAARVDAQWATYQDPSLWEETVAGQGEQVTIDFTGLAPGVDIDATYAAQGVLFGLRDASDTSLSLYPLDTQGVDGGGSIRIDLTRPAVALGIDFPEAAQISLLDDSGATIAVSALCGAAEGPAGFFCGLATSGGSVPFWGVLITDWWDGGAQADDVRIVFEPGPQPLLHCSSGGALAWGLLFDSAGELIDWDVNAGPEPCVVFQPLPPNTGYTIYIQGATAP